MIFLKCLRQKLGAWRGTRSSSYGQGHGAMHVTGTRMRTVLRLYFMLWNAVSLSHGSRSGQTEIWAHATREHVGRSYFDCAVQLNASCASHTVPQVVVSTIQEIFIYFCGSYWCEVWRKRAGGGLDYSGSRENVEGRPADITWVAVLRLTSSALLWQWYM